MTEYKIVLMGGGGVGKSSLVIQFISNQFIEEYDPTIEDSYRKQVMVDDENILLDILDTDGQEEYAAMRDRYVRTGQAFLMIYSITSRKSFEELLSFRDQILRVKDMDSVPMVMVGNKIDLENERVIAVSEGIELAKTFGCEFFETSAKMRVNVDECIYQLVRTVRNREKGYVHNNIKKKKNSCSLF